MGNIVLQAESITKRYAEITAVDDLSLSVNEGEVLGILGPNGAGKTTTINMLVGLLRPDAGQVLYRGHPLQTEDGRRATSVGVCPQEIVLWKKLTCLEQLQFMGQMYGLSGKDSRQRGLQLLEDLALSEKSSKLASTLSGGMQRRLNLAMSLIHDPQLLVLDEPEAGLDPQSRVLVREYIQSLANSKTIIITTHNMDEAERVARRVAIIDHGKLLVLDTPDALKARVGEGDVVEISVRDQITDERQLVDTLIGLDGQISVNVTNSELFIRSRRLVQLLPAIMQQMEALGVDIVDMHIRGNSLEDVFIQLTGRRLRQ